MKDFELATFAAGCFWGVEATFQKVDGVINTTVGYSGGTTKDPSYKEVCTGKTGHAESVQIEFDPNIISYEDLLKLFWNCHTPTTLNRQGADIGTQYRSAIFYHNDTQEELAKKSRDELNRSKKYDSEIVTEIVHAGEFYIAEEYHQKYLEKKK